MASQRPFRFGASGGGRATARDAWVGYAQQLEALGYSTLVLGQHLTLDAAGQIAALATAAAATTTLRVGSTVFINDFYHPTILALEAATIDLLSDGRLELGIGAGWLQSDFDMAGLPFQPPGVRVSRLEEAVRLIKQLLRGEPVTFAGAYYRATGLSLGQKSVQRPHPPIYLGGGGRRLLSLAAREADIVGVDLRATADGRIDLASLTAEAVEEQVNWVRRAAGARLSELELHLLVHNNVVVTDDRQHGAQLVADRIAGLPPTVVSNPGLSNEQILESPHVLIGTVEQIAETLRARRERFGISYITVWAEAVESFAPVVARLAGT
jgi:probable F420-dependent oxidoreductase